jgi:hypothetical protein
MVNVKKPIGLADCQNRTIHIAGAATKDAREQRHGDSLPTFLTWG